jgi:putative membrane protein
VALAVQVGVHVVMRVLLPHLKQSIEANELAAGVTAGGFSACFGLINAACLT